MRVLVLGGGGMLGHVAARTLAEGHEVTATVRHPPPGLMEAIGKRVDVHLGVDATELDALTAAFAKARPDAVVNCIGIVKQRPEADDPVRAILVNSLLPHRLARLCKVAGARLIHISTDCVFSGARGHYTETDPPDAADLYGRSKLLGEVKGPGALTLRTSIVGRELGARQGILEWFLAQRGRTVKGYNRAVFSGVSTIEMARVVRKVLEHHPGLDGVYHVAGRPLPKLQLLVTLRDAFKLDVNIVPDDGVAIDRSLDGSRFAGVTGHRVPDWASMAEELARGALLPKEGGP